MSAPSQLNTTNSSAASAQSKEMPACSGNHSVRLELGSGDYTYLYSLLIKHSKVHENIGHSLISTDIRDVTKDCINCGGLQPLYDEKVVCESCANIELRKEFFSEKGATILTGIDATKLHEDEAIKNLIKEKGPISHIYWNFPHDGSSKPSESMPSLMFNLFSSCLKLFEQEGKNGGDGKEGGKVYLTIAQPPEKKGWYQAGIHDLCRATFMNGFVLKTVRNFGSRYLEYKHRETARAQSNLVAQHGRQFVFQHVLSNSEIKSLVEDSTKRKKTPIEFCVQKYALPKIACSVNCTRMKDGKFRDFYEYTTDSDSTDYSSEDESTESLLSTKTKKLTKHARKHSTNKKGPAGDPLI